MEGLSLDMSSLVDIRDYVNKELALRIRTDIDSQGTFFTDLNGFQVTPGACGPGDPVERACTVLFATIIGTRVVCPDAEGGSRGESDRSGLSLPNFISYRSSLLPYVPVEKSGSTQWLSPSALSLDLFSYFPLSGMPFLCLLRASLSASSRGLPWSLPCRHFSSTAAFALVGLHSFLLSVVGVYVLSFSLD